MAEVNLGRIGFVNKGQWQNGEHKINDTVSYRNSLYGCIKPHTSNNGNILPTDTEYWQLLVDNTNVYTTEQVNNLLLQKPNKNYILNGGLQVWQKGTSFSQNGMTADGWYVNFSGANGMVSRIGNTGVTAGVTDVNTEKTYHLKSPYRIGFKMTSEDNYSSISNWIENIYQFAGNTWTYGFFVYTPSACNVVISIGTFNGGTKIWNQIKQISLKAGWQFISHTVDIPTIPNGSNFAPNNTKLICSVGNVGTQKIEIQLCDAKLEIGSVATPFELEDYTTEILKCQRYFYKVNKTLHASPWDRADSARWAHRDIFFPTKMKNTPSIKLGTISNWKTTPNIGELSQDGFFINGESLNFYGATVNGFTASAEL